VIHCAGAAEELCGRLFQRLGGKAMPDSLWEQDDFTDLVANKKEFIKDLNLSRDWVKHANGQHAKEMDILLAPYLWCPNCAAELNDYNDSRGA
jgi:hypothetical protein